MATFTITASQNIDALTAKTGGDLYNVNGGTLTIDQDSRVGNNQTTSTTLGSITISASLGGIVNIDGTAIWMIPFTGGSGTVPAWNTVITSGTGTGKLIGVHESLTSASTATGAAMPATGFIRVKQKSGTYTAVALTGITATADDSGRIGWIEIVGDDASTVTANRLGAFNITGEWYEVGTTNGTSNQTMQLPSSGLLQHVAGVFIEQTVGGADYEFYPNAGTTTTTGTDATRGKVVWIDNTGLVRIGNSGAATNGYTPVTGLKVVIGNVFLRSAATASRTANIIPNATVASRYDFTATGGGVISVDKCDMNWYFSVSQAYSLNASNSGFIDAIYISEIATPLTIDNIGVGNKPTTALLTPGLQMYYCYAGGTVSNSVFARVSMAASGAYSTILQDIVGFTFTNCTVRANTIQAHATVYSTVATRVKDTTFTNHHIIQGAISLITCDGITMTDTIYVNCVSGTTVTTYATYVWNISSNTINCVFSGLTLPVTNTQPYTSLLVAATGCAGIKLRNIGTYASKLSLGSVNNTAYIYTLATNCSDIKVQRVYVSSTRSGTMTADNSSHEITEESVFGDYADAPLSAALNMTRKGGGSTNSVTAQVSVYGTHWMDYFTSTTAGRLQIMMNEPTALTTSQVTLSNGAAFTSAGGLYMPVIGHQAIFEMPEYIIGHTAFTNSALVMGGGTATNYTYQYQIDTGSGFGSWSADKTPTTLGTALNGETISAVTGFKLKLKITTSTTNATAITSVYMTTVSSTTTQAYQYPLDVITLTLNGLVTESDIVILLAGTDTERVNVDSNSGTTYGYVYETPETIDIGVFKAGYVPFYIRNYILGSTDGSVPIAQVADRNYLL